RITCEQRAAVEIDGQRGDADRAATTRIANLEIAEPDLAEHEAVVERADARAAVHGGREPVLDAVAHERLAPRCVEKREREHGERDERADADANAARDASPQRALDALDRRGVVDDCGLHQNASPTRKNTRKRSMPPP